MVINHADTTNRTIMDKRLANKKTYIVITPLYKDEEKAEKITGIKSYRESTQRMIEANGGL